MTRLEWTKGLEIGVALMDAEHRQLAEAMNKIDQLGQQKAAKAVLDGAIAALVKLTRKHFADEEAHMAKIGYGDLARHKLIHQDLLEKVGKHYQEFQAGDGGVSEAFLNFLVHWLKSHIHGIDRKYAAQPVPAR